MTVRFHLFPFRTQKLSLLVPKIVSWKRLVKIGSRRLLYGPLVKRLRQRPLTPLTSVRFRYGSPYAPLAQLVEQLTLNQWAQGSSPWRCTTTTKSELFSDRRRVRIFCILWKTERVPCFHRKASWTLSQKSTTDHGKSAVRRKGHKHEVRCKSLSFQHGHQLRGAAAPGWENDLHRLNRGRG